LKSLIYIAPDFFPERKANSIHVENQVRSLAGKGVYVYLIFKSRSGEKSFLFDRNVFEIPIKLPRAKRSNLFFLIALVRRLELLRKFPILTRSRTSILLAAFPYFKHRIIFEAHEPLKSGWLKQLVKSRKIPILAISCALKRIIESELKDALKIYVQHDASNLEILEKSRLDFPSKVKAVYVGSIGPGRGIELILKLAERMSEIEFHLIGDIDESNTKVELVNVKFHGWKCKKEIVSIVKVADVLLAPYQRDLILDNGLCTIDYMSPLKIFEYMSYNVPMIVSDFPVIREVLINGFDAILIDPDNFEQWKSSIELLISDQELSNFLSRNALRKLESEFTWDKRSDSIIEIFNDECGCFS